MLSHTEASSGCLLQHHEDDEVPHDAAAGLPSLLTQVIIHKNLWFSLLFRKKQEVLMTL